ncbi:hypothetical protein [Aggregatibacter actinomycetemcomitans]|uniref:hypothetical protein n=1 Tax=Aggregatibacter actinomycetemcomitans TaxID=714 RepID=UPI0006A6C363|nr:hypothetical protein [Aggregatibacter actinomycetemcomitans]KOE64094.1 hypothetical protein A160_0207520 [Aggregatibacter actinomycetemcomitans serotype e str. A160]KOE67844.1 hypothetical protein SCC393_0303230 [Aggregatibacter actinomycetemcomitans serotype e str. SCC393]KYK73970.1 hypothetical protein SA2876_09110 [Aggregatibacter actinomycetemcomitans serotype e str. SA2876]
MKKLLLILTALLFLSFGTNAEPAPKEIYSQFKGINVVNLERDIDLTDGGVLWIRMNFDEPIPEALGSSTIFSEACMNMYMNPETWKKYPVNKIKVTTLVEWRAYLFNGGQKECVEYLTKDGAKEKYSKAPYFEVWERK